MNSQVGTETGQVINNDYKYQHLLNCCAGLQAAGGIADGDEVSVLMRDTEHMHNRDS